MKTYEFPFSIAYADTDAGGIAYHGRYIEIAERARMAMLRGVVLPEGDLGFVVRELRAKYMRPLRLGDEFVVETSLAKSGGASLTLEQKFVKDGDVYAILTVVAAYIGAGMRPRPIPEDVLAIMAD